MWCSLFGCAPDFHWHCIAAAGTCHNMTGHLSWHLAPWTASFQFWPFPVAQASDWKTANVVAGCRKARVAMHARPSCIEVLVQCQAVLSVSNTADVRMKLYLCLSPRVQNCSEWGTGPDINISPACYRGVVQYDCLVARSGAMHVPHMPTCR